MSKRKFIEEHENNLIELRDVDEIKLYCKANGFEIKDQEIENLRTSMQALVNKTSDSQLLKLEDLANVSGGIDKDTADILSAIFNLGGIIIGGVIGGILKAPGLVAMIGLSVGEIGSQVIEGFGTYSEMINREKEAALSYAESAHGNNQCG